MVMVQVEVALLMEAARQLRGYANVLDVSSPPNANLSDKIGGLNEVARQLELAAERNQGARK